VREGGITFLNGVLGVATELDIAKQEIIDQMIAIQQQELIGELENEIQMFKNIAAAPCHPLSISLYSQLFFATGQTFETMRGVVRSNNVAQSRGMALSFNVVGQLYLTLLRGSSEVGSPSCGGSMPGGIGPFNAQSFADIAGKMKQANHDVIGAQQAYSTTGFPIILLPAYFSSFQAFRQSKYYAAKGGRICPHTPERSRQASGTCGQDNFSPYGNTWHLGFCNPSTGQCTPSRAHPEASTCSTALKPAT